MAKLIVLVRKSQIAIEYSYRRRERSPQLSAFWVHASSKARFEQSLVEIATRADMPGTSDGKVDISQLVSKWLADERNGPWLLILDNADDATVLLDPINGTGNGAVSLKCRLLDFLPRVQHGAVVVTTRDRTCALSLTGYRGSPIAVLSMTLGESMEMLRLYLPEAREEEASELVRELEGLPLAISQAGAYIKEVPRVSIPKYLAIFRRSGENKVALLNKNKEDLRRDRGVPNAVVTSWELSFDQIRRSSPKSADSLSLMSYLHRHAIPGFLIQGDVDDLSFEEDINLLISFSLVKAEIREDTFEIHRLVQIALQHWLRSEGYEQLWRDRAIERVAHHFPPKNSWPICEKLMSHADEVILYTPSSIKSELDRARILDRTAWYINSRKGDCVLAEQRSRDALEIHRQYCNEGSGRILTNLNTLAVIQHRLGKFEEAIGLQESILKQRSKDGGQENEEEASVANLHNIAVFSFDLGQYEKAEVLMKRVIEIRERLSDPEDPDLLLSRNVLALINLEMGKYEETVKLHITLLEIYTKYYGFENPDTLATMEHLSLAYLRQNKLEEAERLIASAIPYFTKLFGASHWRTLRAKAVLAKTYYKQRRLDEAKEIVLLSLDVVQSFHVQDRRVTLLCNDLLGAIYYDEGNFTDVLSLSKHTVESAREIYGVDHPDTYSYIFNLAICYHDMGDNDHAIQLMTEVIDKWRYLLPANHPDTANSARFLEAWKVEEEKGKELETEEERSEVESDHEEESEEGESERDEDDKVSEKENGQTEESMREQLAKTYLTSLVSQEIE